MSTAPIAIARLRISLDGIEPEIWRTVEIPVTSSLKLLHDVIQAAMGWQDDHLWRFDAGDRRYGMPDPGWPDRTLIAASKVTLGALVERGVRQFTYTYDLGDDWRHTVAVEAVAPAAAATRYPRLVAGARRCPPEDVGGLPGFALFLDAVADPTHEDHEQLSEWHGGPFDPEDMDEPALQRAIATIARQCVG
ncbi:plasmid pRiA4b ORF-3 family protein [Sphingomonas bacterium]|uniref:plasmid pRiA4b ORF-3 family protein n=1 Tax=Sphingomonas bacterium TaxID=1895847 RepID=UPI00157598FA|nr:plasmid pRiA4b ORF-3 family protein [Sphingomonas bacterium]